MAVVYADLRFTRAPGQVTGAPPDEDWDITYENVPAPKQREDPTQSWRTCPTGLLTPHVTITLILSCTFMVVIIGLSIRLSQVSELHLSTQAELQQLQGEHEDLESRFTQSTLRKDSMVQKLTENQSHTQQELEMTQAALTQIQEKWTTTNWELQKTIREKEETASALLRLQDDLLSTKNDLKGKQEELSRCENNLKSVSSQKKTSEAQLAKTRSDLQNAKGKLLQSENNLLQKDKELNNVKKSLQDTQKNLEVKGRYSEEQIKKQKDLEDRLSDAGKCLNGAACSDVLNIGENPTDVFEYCPKEWHQIGNRCYYFSAEKKTRINAYDECWKHKASLAKVEDEDSVLKDLISKNAGSYWIGLERLNNSWVWSDQTTKKDFKAQNYQSCVKAKPYLIAESCRTALPWICETTTKTCASRTDALHCIGEKTGILGEKHQELQ